MYSQCWLENEDLPIKHLIFRNVICVFQICPHVFQVAIKKSIQAQKKTLLNGNAYQAIEEEVISFLIGFFLPPQFYFRNAAVRDLTIYYVRRTKPRYGNRTFPAVRDFAISFISKCLISNPCGYIVGNVRNEQAGLLQNKISFNKIFASMC